MLLCLMLLVGVCPAALAADTVLEVSFAGLTAQSDGLWETTQLSGRFTVYQGGMQIGEIATDGVSNGSVRLNGAGNVTIVPVQESMPEGYQIHASGYTVTVTEGHINLAPLRVYANAGLFTVQAMDAYEFVLTDARGEEALRFTTDENGWYAVPGAIAAGEYTLQLQGGDFAPIPLTIVMYTGSADQVSAVTVDYVVATPEPTAQPTVEPTAEPTAEPAVEPTVEPTAEPAVEPTAEPTAEPTVEPTVEHTVEPTAEPTATPEPAPQVGALTLEADGEAAYALHQGETLVAQGQLTAGAPAVLEALAPADYIITVTLPDGTAMVKLNDFAVVNRGMAQWQTTVTAGSHGAYTIGLAPLYTVTGTVSGAEGAQVTASGSADTVQTAVSGGVYTMELIGGDYEITIQLPQGEYSAEGWTLNQQEGDVQATLQTNVSAATQLSAVERAADASVSGRAVNVGAGTGVTLKDATGAVAGQTVTAEDGSWSFSSLLDGVYTVHVDAAGGMAAADQAVTLAPGQQLTGVTMTAGKPGSLEIEVFIDGNNNGKGGKYEKMLANVTVSAVAAGDPSLTPVASAVTNKKGAAKIKDLAPGEYVLKVEMPEGYGFGAFGEMGKLSASMMQESGERVQVSAPFTVAPGTDVNCGIGAMELAKVTGYVWLDENGDGKRQSSEPGQAGCRIELVLRGGDTMYELVTGEDGNYAFNSVKPGEYNIRGTTPDGLMFTKYTKSGGNKRSIFTAEGSRKDTKLVELDSGETLDEQNVGLVKESVLQVQCFLDANYNGLFDEGEQPLAGVTAEVLKQSNDGSVAQKVSGEDGLIIFDCLRANTYRLRALLPEGGAFTLVSADPSGNQFLAREGRRENYVNHIEIGTGLTYRMVVGGVWPSSVTGVCYLDDNFSAAREDGESAVSGLTVTLLDESGAKVASDRTNARGVYVFEGVNPGSYTISLNAKKGYAFTKLGDGNIVVNTGDGTGRSEPFSVTLGSSLSGMDVGMIRPGTVQGEVFADANDNGVKDNGEAGLTGAVVRLMSAEGECFSATIGSSGKFCFDAVMPGRYYLRYELPERGVFAQLKSGGNTISGENRMGEGQWFDFTVGSTVNAPMCGALILAQADGVAFTDVNASGTVDGSETMLAGVTLTLTPSRSDLQPLSVTTGGDGSFLLADLHPDTYTLTVSYPDGLVMSRVDTATLPVDAGHASQSVTLNVPMGAVWSQQLLGGVKPASLEGVMWLDENNDGTMDEDEATPAGEKIEIIDQQTGGTFAVITTGEDGSFATSGLIPGLYTVRYQLDSDTIAPVTGSSTFTEDGGMLVMRDVQTASGETTSGLTLGIVRYTNLGGGVWVDLGGSVSELSGAQVTLTDETGAALSTVTTGADGRYAFGRLLPGVYGVSVVLPEGQVAVEPDDERITSGAQVSIMTSCSGRSGSSDPIEVKMGEDQLEMHIGAVLPGKLGDMAWLDLNGNGLQDSGESGVPGVTVELMRGDTVAASTVTDQYGYYRFTEVYPATYTLRVTAPAEVKPTRLRTDFAGVTSVLNEEDGDYATSIPVTVTSDRSNYNADLGFVLRDKDEYPAGYGQGATQDWTRNW